MGPSIQKLLEELITQDRTTVFADEFWTVNLASMALRTDRVFWMDDLLAESKLRPFAIRDLGNLNVPVVCPVPVPDLVPMSEAYPIAEAAELSMKHFGKLYLRNSVAYAVAYAILKGVQTIKMYGCDFTYPDRNFAEAGRACVEAWLVVHAMNGGRVEVAETTSLFDMVSGSMLYGYTDQPNITLPDGTVLSNQQPEMERLTQRMNDLTIGGVVRNAREIDRTLHELANIKRAEETALLKKRLADLAKEAQLEEIDDLSVSRDDPGTPVARAKPAKRDSAGEFEKEATPLPC